MQPKLSDLSVPATQQKYSDSDYRILRYKFEGLSVKHSAITRMLAGVMMAVDKSIENEVGDLTELHQMISKVPELEKWWAEYKASDENLKRDAAIKSREIELARLSSKIAKIHDLGGLATKLMVERKSTLMKEILDLKSTGLVQPSDIKIAPKPAIQERGAK